MKTLPISVDITPLELSPKTLRTLTETNCYDAIVFTSKHAKRIYEAILRRHHITVPRGKMYRVGPRDDLLKLALGGKRVLFPRSDLAPSDIVRTLRARGTFVTAVPIYTAQGRRLTPAQRGALLSGSITQVYFKSPSGIDGLLGQLTRTERMRAKSLPALCIGKTTAAAALKRGWKKVSIKKVL